MSRARIDRVDGDVRLPLRWGSKLRWHWEGTLLLLHGVMGLGV